LRTGRTGPSLAYVSETISVFVAAELSEPVGRYAAEHNMSFESAVSQLLSQGLRTLPGGCFCGRTWHERREAIAQAAGMNAADGDFDA
jgi:hypothetical protein